MTDQIKVVVNVAAMARMVGLSRARFYQLVRAGIFPAPLYDVSTRRPFYDEELQIRCLEVRRRNCGVNGKPVLFYARHNLGSPVTKGRKKTIPAKNHHAELKESMNALGLTSVTPVQIGKVIDELFPQGTSGKEQAEVIRAVFLNLKRQNPGDNVGR